MGLIFLTSIVLSLPGILLATTIHEWTRALVSTSLGDNLPKQKKRLTPNPIRHFEPIGFILALVTGGFGWGKPVETSALYYKNRKQDTLLTAILPSVANLLVAFLCIVIAQFAKFPYGNSLFSVMAQYNVALAIYNCVPVAPMDCVKVLSVLIPANQYFRYLQYEKMVQMIFLLLLFMGVFGGFFQSIIQTILQIFIAATLLFT